MPYKSEAQRKYFNVNRKKLEAQGVDVDEWNSASKGKKMPERVKESSIAQLAKQAVDIETSNPTLLGAGLAGGLLGGAGGALINPGEDENGKKRSRLRNALIGA